MKFDSGTPATPRKQIDPLEKRYGFDKGQKEFIYSVFRNDFFKVKSFAKMSLYVKGLGFQREEIVEGVKLLGEDSLDLGNWEGISGLRPYFENDLGISFKAYTAGITPKQAALMSEDDKTPEKVQTMAHLRHM